VPDQLPAVLAIDGGNSKTDVALVGADGSLLVTARGPGVNAPHDGVPVTVKMLAGLVEQAVAAASPGEAPRAFGAPVALHTYACLANADLPEEEEAICAAMRAEGWSLHTSVVNDTFAVLRAGLPDLAPSAGKTPCSARLAGKTPYGGGDGPQRRPWGVAVTCGAGINCVGLAPDGRSTRYLALGDISGDWGGGFGLARAGLWHAIRAEDGRGEPTALREAVARHFGTGTVYDVTLGVHRGEITEDDLLALAPVLLATAQTGDPVARRLVDRQAEEIFLMIITAMRRLDLTGLATPVVLGGGLLAARDPQLIAGIEARLGQQAPGAVITIIDVPPIAGAALLGLDQAHAGPQAQARLRAAYA
jgi:N-acetylglucosamine kinase-like BadF-type ATPase